MQISMELCQRGKNDLRQGQGIRLIKVYIVNIVKCYYWNEDPKSLSDKIALHRVIEP